MLRRTLLILVLVTGTAFAASMTRWPDQWQGFDRYSDADFALHPEKDEGYGESYFLQAWNAQGEALVVLMSVTNYHPLKDMMQSVDLYWVAAEGEPVMLHAEYEAADLRARLPEGGVGMGPNRVRFGPEGGTMRIDLDEIAADVRFRSWVPPVRPGDGALRFDDGTHWTIHVQAVCADVEAEVTQDGEKRRFQGVGYVDHGWATMKVPDFSREWERIQFCDPGSGLGLSFFQIYPETKYGAAPLTLVVPAYRGEVLGIVTSGTLETLDRVEDPKSGYMVPQRYTFRITGPTFHLEGTIDQLERRADVDVLGALNWLTRNIVKTFYSNPWQHYSVGRLSVRGEVRGAPVAVTGPALVSAQFYD